MFIQQFYTACLSEAAYYIESKGEAVIIDPLRDVDMYIEFAKERGANIKYILETHFHADFVSGHLDLSKRTGAPIVYGPGAHPKFAIHSAKDGEVLPVGDVSIHVMHTPGHTLESTCYLLKDAEQNPHAIFTGDTLFVGDVGRPDLSSGSMSSEELASIMYDTIQNKILPLSDDIIMYPGHGAGSSCGKSLGSETYSTIGEQKKNNYALKIHNKEEFVKAVTDGLNKAPVYFAINAGINQNGYDDVAEVCSRGSKMLTVDEFKSKINEGALILDTRNSNVFTEGFIPGSISIGLEGRFAEWAGNLIPFNQPMILVTEPGKEMESVVRLARVGFDKMEGCLNGGIDAWKNSGQSLDMIINVEADELMMDIPHDPNLVVLDVRNDAEFQSGHLENATHLCLKEMIDPLNLARLEDHENIYVHCAGGYRSVIASSILKREGMHNIRNVSGGWNKIKEEPKAKIVKGAPELN